MLAAAAATKSLKTLTLITHNHHHQRPQLRHFARWVPFKPTPKPKTPQKLRTLKTLKSHLKSSYLVSPFTCHGFSANQFKSLKIPLANSSPSSKLIVSKNTLVAKALKGTQWESLGACMKGMNALLFVKKEEEVTAAMGGVRGVVRDGKLEFNDFSGAVVDGGGGRLYGHLDLQVLESMPGKGESDGMLLGTLYGPGSSLIALLQGFGEEGKAE